MNLENESKYLELRTKRAIYENILTNIGVVDEENFHRLPNAVFMMNRKMENSIRGRISNRILKDSNSYLEITDEDLIKDIYYIVKKHIDKINDEIKTL